MELVRPREVATLLGVTVRTVGRLADAGHLPALRTTGGHRRFRTVDVEKVLRGELASDDLSTELTAPAPPPRPDLPAQPHEGWAPFGANRPWG